MYLLAGSYKQVMDESLRTILWIVNAPGRSGEKIFGENASRF